MPRSDRVSALVLIPATNVSSPYTIPWLTGFRAKRLSLGAGLNLRTIGSGSQTDSFVLACPAA